MKIINIMVIMHPYSTNQTLSINKPINKKATYEELADIFGDKALQDTNPRVIEDIQNALLMSYYIKLSNILSPSLRNTFINSDPKGIAIETLLSIISRMKDFPSFKELELGNDGIRHTFAKYQKKVANEEKVRIRDHPFLSLHKIVVGNAIVENVIENKNILSPLGILELKEEKKIYSEEYEDQLQNEEINKQKLQLSLVYNASRILNPFAQEVFELYYRSKMRLFEIANVTAHHPNTILSSLEMSREHIARSIKEPEWKGPKKDKRTSRLKSKETIAYENSIICRAYGSGVSVQKIMDRFELSETGIRKIINKSYDAQAIHQRRKGTSHTDLINQKRILEDYIESTKHKSKISEQDQVVLDNIITEAPVHDQKKITIEITKQISFEPVYRGYINHITAPIIARCNNYKTESSVYMIISKSPLRDLLVEKRVLAFDDPDKTFNISQALKEFYRNKYDAINSSDIKTNPLLNTSLNI